MSADLPIEMLPLCKRAQMGAPNARKGTGELRRNVLISMPCDMVDQLQSIARQNYRSRNAEIVQRLQGTLNDEQAVEHAASLATAPLLKSDRTPRSHT